MDEVTTAITWEAPEHHHFEKGKDWFWVLWIVAICASLATFFLVNFLLAIQILVGAGTMALLAAKQPEIIEFAVTTRGLRLGDKLYPYSSLSSYCIDEENVLGPQLLVKSKHIYLPLIILPIPIEYINEIDELLIDRLPEEELEEPLVHKILELFGF